MSWYFRFKPYVPVARRRAEAAREIAKREKKGLATAPVRIEGRTITSTFWGKAWCTNLEGYGDYANRLPRGRTYVRNGSVVHLSIEKGKISALVSGSELYEVEIKISALPKLDWQALKQQCAGKIGTLVELLQGKLSKAVMATVTDRNCGLFPKPKEIKMSCSCPDSARMCKHVAAVMYGVGNRLDSAPELLFLLRAVDHRELIEQALPTAAPAGAKRGVPTIAADELGAIFDIEIDAAPGPTSASTTTEKKARSQPTTAKTGKAAKGKRTAPRMKKPTARAAKKG